FAFLEPCLSHRRIRCSGTNDRFNTFHAQYKHQPVHNNRQQKISQRARRDNGKSPPYGLPIKRPRQFAFSYTAFILIKHFDVATERNRRDNPFRLILANTLAEYRLAKAYRESQYFDPVPAGHQIVPEFVKSDQYAQGNDKSD